MIARYKTPLGGGNVLKRRQFPFQVSPSCRLDPHQEGRHSVSREEQKLQQNVTLRKNQISHCHTRREGIFFYILNLNFESNVSSFNPNFKSEFKFVIQQFQSIFSQTRPFDFRCKTSNTPSWTKRKYLYTNPCFVVLMVSTKLLLKATLEGGWVGCSERSGFDRAQVMTTGRPTNHVYVRHISALNVHHNSAWIRHTAKSDQPQAMTG